VRFSIGQGKPSALKRRYDHVRAQQEGINKNSYRIDSLEREVYALKMVLMTDTARGRMVINNFYSAPGSDSTQVKMQRENDFLKQELAGSYVQAERDSSTIAELERRTGARSGAASRAERNAAKSAADQADATADMAKQMSRINKRLRTQNAILAAGAVAAVAVATSGKDSTGSKAAPPAEVVLLSDSTVLIGTDTVRLVVPEGSARLTTLPVDTFPRVVPDTVRITEVRVDTVRVTEQLPGTIAVAEAERQRLMQPVYFATGKTSLGPQGSVKVTEIAAWLKKHPEVDVLVTGVADGTGSAAANEVVAQKRADSVRQGLISNGVDPGRITTKRYLAPAGAPPDPKYRRAEVKFLP
jgi:outer membrane protein OmpA-like peptidoglycan-associated protein